MTDFFINFIYNNIVLSIIILVFLFFKNYLKYKINLKLFYKIYFILMAVLISFFIPLNIFDIFSFFNKTEYVSYNYNNIMFNTQYINTNRQTEDFTIIINKIISDKVIVTAFFIWIVGIIVFLLISIFSYISLKIKINKLKQVNDTAIFTYCKKKVCIKKNLKFFKAPFADAPFTFGLFNVYIVIPDKNVNRMDLKYILLHEMIHFKNKDIYVNYFILILLFLYWINPFIWFLFSEMRNDMEILCDNSVLDLINDYEYKFYGNSLINFVSKNSTNVSDVFYKFGGTQRQIKDRIKNIITYKNNKINLFKNYILFFLTVIVVFISSVFIPEGNFRANSYYKTDSNMKIKEINLKSYFKDIDSCFVFYDLNNDSYYVYNTDKAFLRISPNSTYKLYSALFALEEHVISENNNTLKWNGVKYPFTQWNKNQNLYTAINYSVNWYFNEIDKLTGDEKIKNYFDMIEYGNKDLSSDINNYWLETYSLKISPFEQTCVLKNLFTNKFNFSKDNIDIIKKSIFIYEDNYKLYGKTGSGNVNGNNTSGQFIGFAQTKSNTYFFCCYLYNNDNATGQYAKNKTIEILENINC